MWKKVLIACIALIGTFTIGTAFCNYWMYASTNYNVSADSTVKLGEKGQYPNGSYGSMSKGDKVYIGTEHPTTGEPLSFILLVEETYKTYQPIASDANYSFDTSVPNVSGWFAMGNDVIANISYFSSFPPLKKVSDMYYYFVDNYLTTEPTSLIASELANINAAVTATTKEILLPRNLNQLQHIYQQRAKNTTIGKVAQENLNYALYSPKTFFIADSFTLQNRSGDTAIVAAFGYGLTGKDLTFKQGYFDSRVISTVNSNQQLEILHYDSNGSRKSDTSCKSESTGSCGTAHAVRVSAEFDFSKVVFGTGMGSGSTFSKVKNSNPVLGSYTDIYNAVSNYDKLKLRMLDDSGNHAISLNDIKNSNSNSVSKISKTSTVYFDANAVSGSNSNGVNTVSALFFKNNELAYYVPLADANGNQLYALDLTGFAAGKYQVALVNESYDQNNMSPTESSALTEFKELEITENLSNLAFTPKPNLQVNSNVGVGESVGTIASQYGAGKITYTLINDPAYPNEYQHLKLATDGITVIVNGNSLNAGTYHFKIQAKDENDDPVPPLEISASITVNKTNASVSFNDSSITKKSISDAAVSWNETATAAPTAQTKVTYSVSGGDVGLIDIDSDTGAITYKGTGGFGKVKIKATVDDDPSTGNDNYDPIDTEKEIIIYREVDGNVTPDANSSDISVPTFSASDPNVKINGIIGTIHGTLGTPDTIGGSTTTYTYGLKAGAGDANFFSVDSNTGVITATANLGVKGYSITVTVSDKWSTKEIPVSINVGVANAEDLKFYENSTSNTVITTQSAKITDTNVFVYATVKGSSNTNPVTYKVKDGSINVVEVNANSGKIDPKGVGTVTIVAEKAGDSGQAKAIAELTFTVTAGEQNFIYTDATLSNALPKSGDHYDPYVETYQTGKNFQLYTAGYPTGASVTYQLKAGSPTDVISVDSNGLVHILNASMNNQMGKVIVEATSHDPSNHYTDKTIELPINIEKGTRVIRFADDPIYAINGKGSITPVTEVDGNIDTDGDVLIEVDANEDGSIAWTNDNKTIQYNYSGTDAKDIKIHATKPMDRNYKAAEADGTLHIMGPDENVLAITSPGQIIYGDHFTIRSTQYDAGSTNVQYQFEIDDTTYLSAPTVNGNIAEFDAIKYSGNKKTTIKVTRTADGETPLSKTISVQVLPKEIEIIIDDKDKYKGEENPPLTYQDFKSQLVSWNGVQDVIQEHDIKLSTTAQTNSQAGNYPIKGDASILNNTYPNYSFKFADGTLTVKEDNIEDNWYHVKIADESHTSYTGDFTNRDVDIISDHTEYVNLSLDQSTWNPQKVTVGKEGETNQSFWMKKDSGAITKEKQEIIRIDKTSPKIKGIKAKDSNNQLQDIINSLSGGIFFQPGTAFEITTSDENSTLKVSGTKEISYKIYKVESTARFGEEEISNGVLSVTNEKASITIGETTGTYRVCVIPNDNAGNIGEESCHEVTLKKIDVDVDGDGKPDFNDPDGDGCPDLNIKWKDPSDPNKWIIINGDRDYDGIPDLNIDSDGDGKPDLNIDTDHDGKPDLNLTMLKKTDSQGTPAVWKPNKCVKQDITNGILEEYCTGTTVKAAINVDLDGDGIPDINIDNKGDFKPHLNLSTDGTNATVNLADVHEWKPNKNYESKKFAYDSIGSEYKAQINIDSDGDGRPDLNLDLDDDGVPDLNIDTNGDNIPDIDIDGDGDGIADVNIDTDDDGNPDENIIEITEWNPKKDVNGDIPYDTMEIQLPNDSDKQQEPSDPQEPQDPKEPDETKEPNDPQEPNKQGDPSTNVQGNYYPGNNVGGATTGDTTNLMMYMGTSLLSLGIIFLVIYKKKSES